MFFEHVRCTSLFNIFSNQISLLSRGPSLITLKEIRSLSDSQIAEFLQLVIKAVNNMITFVNNILNFIDHDTKIPEFGTQLQMYCSIQLLFGNISNLNQSVDGFQRISQAMGAIDKLANLKKYLFSRTVPEESIFQQIFSIEEKHRLVKIIDEEVDNGGVKLLITNLLEQVYEELHAHYLKDMKEMGEDERHRLMRVRNQRNLHHGAFLLADKFHEIFGTSAGEAADEVVAVAWLSTLCFAIAPQKYLGGGTGAPK